MNQENANRSKSQQYMRDQIIKWREKRQTRMIGRVLHNRQGNVSSAVFGAISTAIAGEDKTFLRNQQICNPEKPESKPVKSSGAKKKPQKMPVIKHNLASKLRMIKANPLLEERGIITVPEKYKKGLDRIDIKNTSIYDKETKLPMNLMKNSQVQKSSVRISNFQKKATSNKCTPKGRSSRKDNPRTCTSVNRNTMGLRSHSADASCRNCTNTTNEQDSKMKRFHSVANMQGLDVPMEDEEDLENGIFPLPGTPVSVQTPRRFTHVSFSNSVGRQSMVSPSGAYTPAPHIMRKQLSDWLKKRGKTFGSFHHLQCFGLHASTKTSDFRKSTYSQKITTSKRNNLTKSSTKPLTSALEPCTSAKTEASDVQRSINVSECENKENVCTQNFDTIAQDALEDLIRVIKLGYPLEQCNHWLTVICRAFPGVKEVPVYWECFALLEEARGDLKSAVDCYERAIIRGAPPEKVSDSLDQLMEKFNLMNLKPDVQADGTSKTPRKQVLDARNIFKSTIIRFALQQKAVKSLSSNLGVPATSLNYVATPVRRSTRSSSTRYSVTPGVLCLKSLNQLEPDLRKSVIFKPNLAFE